MRSDKRISKPLADCVLIAALVALALIAYLILSAGNPRAKPLSSAKTARFLANIP